jgi:signal transduction histidine kinase
LQRSVFPPLPPEHRAGFAQHLAYANWLHALLLSPVVLVMNLFFGLLPELHYYSTGYWSPDSLHLTLTAVHVFTVIASLVAIPLLLRGRPSNDRSGQPRHQRLALGYASLMLAAITVFSVAEQGITGSISAYLLGVAGVATLFYTTPRFSFWVFFLSMMGLLGGSLCIRTDWEQLWHNLFVAFDASVIFWAGSRVVYSLKASNYLQLVRIEEQARQLAASNEELARANRFKSELLSCAAHDLRNQLGTISLSAQTLEEELPPASSLRSFTAVIDDSARRLAEFVGNLLTSDAVENARLELDCVPTRLAALVTTAVENNRPLAAAKSITLHLAIDEPAQRAPTASLDRTHFAQAVENLLTNAIKFSPERKNVWISVTYNAAHGHQLTVRDEGPGLTAHDLRQLFGKYQRLSARPTSGEQSTGLGLFIVKQLVNLHGGEVRAESDGPGRGARFIVTLPDSCPRCDTPSPSLLSSPLV